MSNSDTTTKSEPVDPHEELAKAIAQDMIFARIADSRFVPAIKTLVKARLARAAEQASAGTPKKSSMMERLFGPANPSDDFNRGT